MFTVWRFITNWQARSLYSLYQYLRRLKLSYLMLIKYYITSTLGRASKTRLFSGHVPNQGGGIGDISPIRGGGVSTPLPQKKSWFFSDKMLKIFSMPWIFFLLKPFWINPRLATPKCVGWLILNWFFLGWSMVDWGWGGEGAVNFWNIYIILGPEWHKLIILRNLSSWIEIGGIYLIIFTNFTFLIIIVWN